jgi:hypothetical protein
MIKVTSSISYPSKTVPGRNQSTYLSTPIPDPTPSKVIKVLQEHFNSLQHHLKISDLDGLKFSVVIE